MKKSSQMLPVRRVKITGPAMTGSNSARGSREGFMARDVPRLWFRRRLRRYAEDISADRAYPFLIFRIADHALIGGVTLANVRRGIVQAGTVGYWTGEQFAGQGYMTLALKVLLPFIFSELSLHRIEAACIPTNKASVRVLEKCGFVREGLARRYLCINGIWQDHLLFGLLNEDLKG